MASVRSCVCLLVFLVHLQGTLGKYSLEIVCRINIFLCKQSDEIPGGKWTPLPMIISDMLPGKDTKMNSLFKGSQVIILWGKLQPFFGWLWCDMMCDDDDITSTTSADTTPDFLDFMFDCSDCPQSQPGATPTPAQSIAMRLPALPGLTMNVTNSGGAVQFVMDAVSSMGQQQTAAPATAAPPATTAAPAANTTAAP